MVSPAPPPPPPNHQNTHISGGAEKLGNRGKEEYQVSYICNYTHVCLCMDIFLFVICFYYVIWCVYCDI
jgi:hypothetical protein